MSNGICCRSATHAMLLAQNTLGNGRVHAGGPRRTCCPLPPPRLLEVPDASVPPWASIGRCPQRAQIKSTRGTLFRWTWCRRARARAMTTPLIWPSRLHAPGVPTRTSPAPPVLIARSPWPPSVRVVSCLSTGVTPPLALGWRFLSLSAPCHSPLSTTRSVRYHTLVSIHDGAAQGYRTHVVERV